MNRVRNEFEKRHIERKEEETRMRGWGVRTRMTIEKRRSVNMNLDIHEGLYVLEGNDEIVQVCFKCMNNSKPKDRKTREGYECARSGTEREYEKKENLDI